MVKCIAVVHYPDVRQENWKLLTEAADARGVALQTWEPHRLQIECRDDRASVLYDGRPATPEVVIHRTVSRFQGIVLPALTLWANAGAQVINAPGPANRARDKLLTTLMLIEAKVDHVPTVAFIDPNPVALSRVAAGCLVIKPAHGVRGEGIQAYSTVAEVPTKDRFDAPQLGAPPNEHYLAQPLVRGGGEDLRAFVVGSVCIGLMRRVAPPGEIRANLALGATGTPLPRTHRAASVAVAALTACGLDYGGVDLIEDEAGTIRVLEVDAWAGFAGITAVTGGDVAGAILDLAISARARGSVS